MGSIGLENGTPASAVQTNGSLRLDGKIALVTGASRGIGRGIALDLASRGANVAVNYHRSAEAAEEVVATIKSLGRKAVAIQADVASFPDIVRMFDEAVQSLGNIDIVVSNSGMDFFASIEKTTPEMYDKITNLNTRAQFFVAQQGYLRMNNGGRIILMSSIAGYMRGLAGHAIYSASKAAIDAMVRCFPSDFAPKHVTCNAVAPGGVCSDMAAENAWQYTPNGRPGMPADEIYTEWAASNPLGRAAVPEDVAKTVAFLASDESDWINGQTITLAGGSRTGG